MGQCFPDRQREQFPFDGRSTDFRRRPYFRLGIAVVKAKVLKDNGKSSAFEPRHVLNRTRDVDRVSSSGFVFRGLQTGGGRFGLLDNLLGDLLTCSDRFLRGGFGGFCSFFRLRFGFFSAFLRSLLRLGARLLRRPCMVLVALDAVALVLLATWRPMKPFRGRR